MHLCSQLDNTDTLNQNEENSVIGTVQISERCHIYNESSSGITCDLNMSNNIETIRAIEDNIEQSPEISSCVDNAYDSDNNNNNDTDKDPDYSYNNDSESSVEEDEICEQSCRTDSNNVTRSSLETSLNTSGKKICDDATLHVENSKPKGANKQNFCYYCKKLQSKISRHLEQVHKNEEEVKAFISLPKGKQ